MNTAGVRYCCCDAAALTPSDYARHRDHRGYATLDYRRHLPNIDLNISVNALHCVRLGEVPDPEKKERFGGRTRTQNIQLQIAAAVASGN